MPTVPLPSVVAGANGAATITIRPNGRWRWIVSQITTKAPAAPFGSLCEIKRNGAPFIPFLVPTGDVASGVPYLDLGPGDSATIDWTLLTPGIRVSATIVYDIAQTGGPIG